MPLPTLLHELIRSGADRAPQAPALTSGAQTLSYEAVQTAVAGFASGLIGLGLGRSDRVGIYLEKRFETVIASFGAPAAGGVFVPMNPLLKPEQVVYIARDCDVRVLVTSPERLVLLAPLLTQCPALHQVVLTTVPAELPALPPGVTVLAWADLLASPAAAGHRVIDTDLTAILYTSGSTGRPKGVVLSHRNMVAGALSVASYLGNHAGATLLAALPL
ncbi:MAG: acyl--CoA ligase, partial [Burkholderiales bacterium PBB5]